MTEPQFQRLMKEVGRADALADPRFADWPTRIDNDKALHEIIEAELMKETSATWAERFAKADVPAGRVLSIPETAQLDLLQHRTDAADRSTRQHGPIKVVGSGFRLEHGGGSVERPPATLGEHTDEVLGEAGYSAADDSRHARGQGRLIARRGCGRWRRRVGGIRRAARRWRRHRGVAGLGRRGATGVGQTVRQIGPAGVGRIALGAVGDQTLGVGILPAGHGGIDRGGDGADLGILAGAVGLGALELGAGDGDLGHVGGDGMRVVQRFVGGGEIALRRAAPRGGNQLERARILRPQIAWPGGRRRDGRWQRGSGDRPSRHRSR